MKLLRYLPRFRAVRKTVEQYDVQSRWSREAIEAFQLDRLNKVWKTACQTTSYFRDLKQTARLPEFFESLEQFREVPVLQKDTVRDCPNLILSSSTARGKWQRTGGSTGKPTSVYWEDEAHRRSLRLRYAWLSRHGIDVFDRHAMLWGHAGSFVPGLNGKLAKLRQPIEDWLRNRLRLSAYNLGPTNIDRYLQQLKTSRVRWLYGYSSAVLAMAQRAKATSHDNRFDLRLIILTGETAHHGDSNFVSEVFQCPCRLEYGSVECGNIAFENEQKLLEVQDCHRLVETVPRGDGYFDILVTLLDNPSFPLIRYAIGDVTADEIRRPQIGFSCLATVEGRNNDFLVGEDLQLVHANMLKHILENFPTVARFQAVQNDDRSITLTIERSAAVDELDNSRIERQLRQHLGNVAIKIKIVDRIEGNLAGKHRWVISSAMKTRPDAGYSVPKS